ncbi:uncharacterized protein LOC142632631 [Castanea sativa]|uniref:uncharacterized protein LOC142632631 n=1 Tax=Castanea sativa TaxID=21020 RepID=UPI003F6517DF
MSSLEVARQMALWAIELSEFDIQYCLRTAIKGQVIADFIAELTHKGDQGAGGNPQWMVHTNGSSNKHARGAGVVLRSLEGDEVKCMVRLDFPTTNNEAEYEALITGLDLAQATGATDVIVHCDSQVVTSQINGGYECRGERMKELLGLEYLEQVKNRMHNLNTKFVQIPREENERIDRLAKAEIGTENNWTTSITSYLKDGMLHNDKEAARKLRVYAT